METTTKKIHNIKRLDKIPELKLNNRSNFISLTSVLMEMSRRRILLCPGCRNPLNLEYGVEWQGPMDITCRFCKTLVNIKSLIQF